VLKRFSKLYRPKVLKQQFSKLHRPKVLKWFSKPYRLPHVTDSHQFIAPLRTYDEFNRMRDQYPQYFEDRWEREVIVYGQRHGYHSEFFGHVPPSEVSMIGDEAREDLRFKNLNSRQHLILNQIVSFLRERGIKDQDAKLYAHEAITPLALALRGRYPKFIGTEYTRDDVERKALFPILHGDICNSGMPSDTFDLVASCDVLEHVPDIDAALRETFRILKGGGLFIGTFPFRYEVERTPRLASVVDGEIIHHIAEPIYHGNPMGGGSLVFELPSWNIIGRAKQAGFNDPYVALVCDKYRGIVGSSLGFPYRARGIFLAVFDKRAA
jgi:SAM-dependent methyltransferase